jgi:L,D-peptidoglycan transpeptidase YkuD (ErfK/YbiS/YcfS/YnhG family)
MKITVRHPGDVCIGNDIFRCALGRRGIGDKSGEGDGVTPIGTFALRCVYYRPDRLSPPKTALPQFALKTTDGWCDEPDHPDYNKLISTPFPDSHEALWREDALYNLIIPLGYNDDPVIPGKGSAIFMHVAQPGFTPTEGCIALQTSDLLTVLGQSQPGTMIDIIRP